MMRNLSKGWGKSSGEPGEINLEKRYEYAERALADEAADRTRVL